MGELSERIRQLEIRQCAHDPQAWPDPGAIPHALPWNHPEPLAWNGARTESITPAIERSRDCRSTENEIEQLPDVSPEAATLQCANVRL